MSKYLDDEKLLLKNQSNTEMTDQKSVGFAGSGGNGLATPITDTITKTTDGINWGVLKIAEGINWIVLKISEGINALIRYVNWCGIDGAVCSDTAGKFDWVQYYVCGFYPLIEALVYPVYWWLSSPETPRGAIHQLHFGILCFLLAVNCAAAAESSLRCISYILSTWGSDRWVRWLKWLKRRYPVVPCHAPVLISSMHFRASLFCLANFWWYYKHSLMYVTESKGACVTTLVAFSIHFLLTFFWCTVNSRETKKDLNEFLADESIFLPTSREALSRGIKV